MSRLRTVRRFAVMMVSLLMIAGCGGHSTIEAGGYTIYVHERSLLPRGGTDAQVAGTLAMHDGCVVLEVADAEIWYPVIWPSGTSIASSDPFVIELPSGEELAVGENVSGGGGYLQPERVDVNVARECLPDTNEIAVFNPDGDPSTN